MTPEQQQFIHHLARLAVRRYKAAPGGNDSRTTAPGGTRHNEKEKRMHKQKGEAITAFAAVLFLFVIGLATIAADNKTKLDEATSATAQAK